MVIVSACRALSMMKGLPEGAEDGVRDTLYELAHTGPYGGESQGSANLHRPEGAYELGLLLHGLVFVISRAALL